MSETGRDADSPALPAARTERRAPPAWGVLLFLGLLAGLLFLNRWISSGGPPVRWIENDLNAALDQAQAVQQRVFLYLYEAKDPVHARNEREVFSQRWARDVLQLAVCCRIAVRPNNDLVAMKYRYENTPLFLLLKADGREMTRTQGPADERQFMTYIGMPLKSAANKP